MSKTVNGVTTTFTYSGNLLMRQSDGTTTLDFQYDAGGSLIGYVQDGVSYFYTRNLQGDITDVYYFDSKGMRKSVASYSYDAWGLVNASNIDNPFRYRGYYYDYETGLYFLQTRYYDPTVRRFLNADSLFIAGDEVTGANMYAYCNGNPVMYSDPSGKMSEMHLFAEALNIFFIAWAEFGLADAMRTLAVLKAARDATENNEEVFDFLVSFKNGIEKMIETDEQLVAFDTPYLATHKEVSIAMAKYFDPYLDMSEDQIAQEIWFHAMFTYHFDDLKNLLTDKQVKDLMESARYTELETGGDVWWRRSIYFIVWNNFIDL